MCARFSADLPARWAVIGMGSAAFGKERRAVTAFRHMPNISPYFLTTVWEDGSVAALLQAHKFDYSSVTIGYLGRARLRWTVHNLVTMPRLSWRIIEEHRKQGTRGVVLLALVPFANTVVPLVLLKLLYRTPLVFYLGDIPANTLPSRLLARLASWMGNAFIANSEAVRRGLVEVGFPANRVEVIHNGVAMERFSAATPFPWRKEFAWSESALLIGYAGQFANNKGVLDFLTAAKIVLARTEDCRFVLLGKIDPANPSYQEILTFIRSNSLENYIVCVGWTSEMERAYAALDLVVVPSRHEEPAANVIIEAQAAGVPVIGTCVGGTPELLCDGKSGFLVPKAAPAQIAERILLLQHDRTLLRSMSKNARAHAEARFDAKKNANLIERLLLQLLKV